MSSSIKVSNAAPAVRPPPVGRPHRPVNTLRCLAIMGLAGGLLALAGCGMGGPAAAGAGGPPVRPPAPVRIQAIEARKVSPKVTVVGSVTPIRTSVVASGSSGIVDRFLVDEGQYVKTGDILSVLRMQTTDLEIEENKALMREREQAWQELVNGYRAEEVAEGKARMEAAAAVQTSTAARLERIRTLILQKAASQDDLDESQEKANSANQMYLAARATYDKLQAGPRAEEIEQAHSRYTAQKEHVALLEAEKEKRTTKAPFDGFVVQEHTHEGQWLAFGDSVVTLVSLGEVDLVVNVDEKDIHHLSLGQKAHVAVHAADHPEWTGQVVQIVPQSDWKSGSRGFPVKVRLQNKFIESRTGAQLPVLKAGMTAHVTFTGLPIEAVLVSKDAVVRSAQGTMLYVFVPDQADSTGALGKVRPVPMREGIQDGNFVQVFAEGLPAGSQVVVEGAERLRPFQDVRVLPAAGSAPSPAR